MATSTIITRDLNSAVPLKITGTNVGTANTIFTAGGGANTGNHIYVVAWINSGTTAYNLTLLWGAAAAGNEMPILITPNNVFEIPRIGFTLPNTELVAGFCADVGYTNEISVVPVSSLMDNN